MPFSPRLAASADPRLKPEGSSEAEKLKGERKASRNAAKAAARGEGEVVNKAARIAAKTKAQEAENGETKPVVEEVGTKKRKACLNDGKEAADAKQR
eukprot:CAMPEP_0177182636 /NCGR_PEP_ID=MMETSP0367-20130122/16574_1 /TAXON_ID=447022 ORGANISM="Scrippsiella hangoei-like, Strain SHHI-4" /NCGR_SAMPLE_ID=MMETSP0367 /ASSEMBLY_ACC=CAM_ASM_000362 /LENGTH=96 /DNA_ID=CAMNT_0018629587 /DNA_START=1 /DNA_END=288 /DNA_ORIENTATION=+